MPVPNFDTAQHALQSLPINYRLPKWTAFLKSMLAALSWRLNVFKGYRMGESLLPYDSGTTYGIGDTAQYNFRTYESLITSNTGNQPDVNSGYEGAAWVKRNDSFIGAAERVKYDGKYLSLTYALNRYFGTTFRQPPYPAPYDFGSGTGTWPDIYITNDAATYTSFLVYPAGASPIYPSASYPYTSTAVVLVNPAFTGITTYKFVVNIPTAVYNALGATTAIRNAVINTFVARYAVAGTQWRIATY